MSKNRKKGKTGAAPARQQALQQLMRVAAGISLSSPQAKIMDGMEDGRDRALCQELVYGVLRWQLKLDALLRYLLKKNLKDKDRDIQMILRLALYELLECRTPDYAVINDAVLQVRGCGKNWATGLVNAILRNFLRNRESLLDRLNESIERYSHPAWMVARIQHDWPDQWQQILQANNQHPPLWLRVNPRHISPQDYISRLHDNGIESQVHAYAGQALSLSDGVDVTSLPGFSQGEISVQDAGAQLAASLLQPRSDDNVLDLCAAPGGKTAHLLEVYPYIKKMVAVDVEVTRMTRMEENLHRLRVQAECLVSDARNIADKFERGYFQRILLDAPCSASGVIRRHPDIKTLRRESDLDKLEKLQSEILHAAWQVLSEDGQLLYVTCSVFSQENQMQIEHFLAQTADAMVLDINVQWGHACSVGRQLLPGEEQTDGFYFCLLQKKGV